MENLTREYFLELGKKYPEAVEHFLSWLEQYKVTIGWDNLFNQEGIDPVIDFYGMPYDMQNGIIARFDLEKFYGKAGYLKCKLAEPKRHDKLFADVQQAIKTKMIKYN